MKIKLTLLTLIALISSGCSYNVRTGVGINIHKGYPLQSLGIYHSHCLVRADGLILCP